MINKWTKTQVEILKNSYPTKSNKEISQEIGRDVNSVKHKAKVLKLTKSVDYIKPNRWTESEKSLLVELFGNNSNKYLSTIFDRTDLTISAEARRLGLSKTKEYINIIQKKQTELVTTLKRTTSPSLWNLEKEAKLTELYANNSNDELVIVFGITKSSITNKAKRLGLKKSKEQKSKMIAKRNKMVGRDLTFELVKEIASKYKTRGQFQKEDSSAYSFAQKSGLLDDICTHMFSQSFSIPQLIMLHVIKSLLPEGTTIDYNTRKIIKPFELDIWIPEFRLALEYDGKGWHTEENNKSEMCRNAGIELIVLIENSRKYEEDVKFQIINNLEKINLITGLNVIPEQVNAVEITKECFGSILDVEGIREICQKYTTIQDFTADHKDLYDKLRRQDRLMEFTGHMERAHKIDFWSNPENIINIVNKHTTLKSLIENDFSCYEYIMRHKENLYLISHLERSKGVVSFWADTENIINTASKYTTLKEFIEKEKTCYNYILKHKELRPLISHLKESKGVISFWENPENIINAASKYTTLKEFIENENTCYNYILDHKELKPLISHLKRVGVESGFWSIPENIINTVSKYSTLKDFRDNENACYCYIMSHKELLPLIEHLKRRVFKKFQTS